jgi:hypothetical protein
MGDFTFVSWENDKLVFDNEAAGSIKFLENVPEPGEEIGLRQLEIDTNTLQMIKTFTQIKGKFPTIKKPLNVSKPEPIFENDSPYKAFFENIDEDQLLLLTLAAHRLTIDTLQELCIAIIASKFSEMDAEQVIQDLTEEELTINEEDYMKVCEIKWLN